MRASSIRLPLGAAPRGLLLAALVATAVARPAAGQQPLAASPQEIQTVVNARTSFEQFFTSPMESLPTAMLQKAEGVAIFPNMIKGGFILGVNFGRGVLHVRNPDRTWSPPVMVTMGGGSLGFQAGVQAADILLVFSTPQSLNGVLQGKKVTLGADASVAAGPVGIQANAGTDARLGAEIYSYARSRGLFLGVSLGGADLSIDNNANSMLYGRFGVTPADVFQNRGLVFHPEVQQLLAALDARTPGAAVAAAPATPSGFPPAQPQTPLPTAQPGFLQPPPLPQSPPQPVPATPAPPAAPPLVPIRQ